MKRNIDFVEIIIVTTHKINWALSAFIYLLPFKKLYFGCILTATCFLFLKGQLKKIDGKLMLNSITAVNDKLTSKRIFMQNHLPNRPTNMPPVADAEWMMIHCDAFISDRDRILMKENAFVIDRDLSIATPHLPNQHFNGKSNVQPVMADGTFSDLFNKKNSSF